MPTSPERSAPSELSHPRMLTARAATIRTVTAAISASKPMKSLARWVSGIASVGLKAIEFVTAT